MEGNARFVKGESLHPDRSTERREETREKQEPFAIILGCSDSRVSPEIIFDQGIGDLFIVRVAGNVVSAVELDSIEFSALYLHSSLVLVLGHENCGAVNAVLEGQTEKIETVASLIQKAIDEAKLNKKENVLESAIIANVHHVVDQLKNNQNLKALIDRGLLNVVGGYYHFRTGEVDFFL